jgi:hypothetical protein
MDLTSKIGEQDREQCSGGPGGRGRLRCIARPGLSWNGQERGRNVRAAVLLVDTQRQLRSFHSTCDEDPRSVPDSRRRSSFSAAKKNVLYLPRQALFLKDGKRIVYVKKGNGYEQREVKIRARMKAARPLMGWKKAAASHWSIQPRRARQPGSSSGRQHGRDALMARFNSHDCRSVFCSATSSGRETCNWACRTCCCMDALAAHHAGHDLRRGRGGGHALHRRGRTPESDGPHRANGRPQSHCGSEGDLEWQAHQKVRKISPGLTLQDYRVIRDDLEGIVASTPRKQLTPSKIIPKAQQDMPNVMGVNSTYQQIAGLHS